MPDTRSNELQIYSPLTGLVFIFNLIVGTGALTMPAAFFNAGWTISLLIVIILCFVSFVTTTFIIECMSTANAIKKITAQQTTVEITASQSDENQSDENQENEGTNCLVADVREKVPLLECPNDNDEYTRQQECCQITQRIELGAMANMFFSPLGVKLFYVCIAAYLYGDLAIYAAAISKSLRDMTCDYEHIPCNQTLILSDPCWNNVDINRMNAYRIYLLVVLILIGPFTFFNVQKTKYLQILTTFFRWIAFVSMITLASIALISGQGRGKPKSVVINGIPNLFGVCVYSFMCHHSLPGLITPIKNKKNLFWLIFADYGLILVFYSLLSLTGIFTFDALEDFYTLNFQAQKCQNVQNESPVYEVPGLDYFLPLFPVFTLSTNFPIIAITLKNNMTALLMPNVSSNTSSLKLYKVLLTLFCIMPPFGIAFVTQDLEVLVGFVGSYAGACIQYIIPAFLIFYSRKKIYEYYPTFNPYDNVFSTPFRNNVWIILVFIWAVICIIFVTTNHVIQFQK